MTSLRALAAAVLLSAGSSGLAHAQTAPAEPLPDLTDEGLEVTQSFTVFTPTQNPGTDEFESENGFDLRHFLDADYLADRTGVPAANINAITGQFTYRGLSFVGESSSFLTNPVPNTTAAAIRIYSPALGGAPLPLLSNNPALGSRDADTRQGCVSFIWDSVRFGTATAAPPAYADLRREVHARYVESLEDGDFGRCIAVRSARETATDPVVGNPNSVQGTAIRTALTLDDAFEFGIEEDPEIIGGSTTYFSSGGVDGNRTDVRVRKGYRIVEGGRSRLLIDIPVTLITANGDTALHGNFAVGYDTVISDRWSVTPRISFGVVASNELGADGEVVLASVSSRYRFPQIGRGDLVLGNMIGYSTTVSTGLTGAINPEIQNTVFRNGAAYQYPLRGRYFGRQASLRVGYAHTAIAGDDVFLDSHHDFSVSFGVRAREGDVRNRYEVLRLGLTATVGDNYDSVTVTAGFRY